MICIFVFICSYAQAQIGSRKKVLGKTDTLIQNDTLRKAKIEKQKDVTDIINKGVFKIFFGKPDTVLKQKGKLYTSLLPAAGYSLHTKWAVSVGANGAFYTDEIDKVNLSVVNIGPTYTLRNQFICPVQSNIWSKENKYNFLGNWIF